MNQILIYTADCRGNVTNSRYPKKRIITSLDEFHEAVAYNHVCAGYRNYHRSVADIISADCLMMDCNNIHSDNPSDLVTPEQVTLLCQACSSMSAIHETTASLEFGILSKWEQE